jgi:nucleoside-diphosphate-sugar epimerase
VILWQALVGGPSSGKTPALDADVKRVVLTSSVAAATPRGGGRVSLTDETIWTDLDDPGVSAYSRSKTVAERAAWDLVRTSDGATTLATVNPSVVLGPVLSRDYSPSVELVERLLSGKVPGLPRLGFSIVDVRDVADLHIAAMIAPQAAGERFIAAGDLTRLTALWMFYVRVWPISKMSRRHQHRMVYAPTISVLSRLVPYAPRGRQPQNRSGRRT